MTSIIEDNTITACFLNRTIVELRKIVDQCRVRCTRKLLHQLEKLKTKKGNEQQMEKNKRKVAKLLAEVQEIKKIKADDVSKFALINTKTLPELMANAPAEKAALYKLALCTPLMNKVDDFREKCPKWPIEVPFILQRLGLQYKTKKNVTKRNNGTEKFKKIKRKTNAKKKVDGNEMAEDDEIRESTSNQEGENEKDYCKTVKKSIKVSDRISKSTQHEADNKKENAEVVEICEKVDVEIEPEIPVSEKRSKAKHAVVPLKEGKIGQMEVRRLKLDEIFGDEILSEENESKTLTVHKPKLTDNGHLKNDPFFANSDDDDDELDKNNIQDDNEESMDFLLEDDEEDNKRKKVKPNSLKTKFASSLKMGNDTTKIEAKTPLKEREIQPRRAPREARNANLMPLGNKNPTQNSGENRKTRRMKMRQEAEKTAELANLHPSWQAKKKMNNPTLVPAAGKKIKFSED